MPAYLIAEIQVTDPAQYEEYRKRVPAAISKFGGKFLSRGGKVAPLEGGWSPSRIAVIEFASLDQAQRFYASPEYQHAKEARMGAAQVRIIAVEGT
jgi:uncharacterized protein (DUF1330 family)